MKKRTREWVRKAEADYRRALELNPDDEEIHFDLGAVYDEVEHAQGSGGYSRNSVQGI